MIRYINIEESYKLNLIYDEDPYDIYTLDVNGEFMILESENLFMELHHLQPRQIMKKIEELETILDIEEYTIFYMSNISERKYNIIVVPSCNLLE